MSKFSILYCNSMLGIGYPIHIQDNDEEKREKPIVLLLYVNVSELLF